MSIKSHTCTSVIEPLSDDIDWKGFPDPLDYINHESLAKDFLETFADGSDYLWDKTNDIVFEFQQ